MENFILYAVICTFYMVVIQDLNRSNSLLLKTTCDLYRTCQFFNKRYSFAKTTSLKCFKYSQENIVSRYETCYIQQFTIKELLHMYFPEYFLLFLQVFQGFFDTSYSTKPIKKLSGTREMLAHSFPMHPFSTP